MHPADPAPAFVPPPPAPVGHAPSGPLHGLGLVAEEVFDVAGYPEAAGFPEGGEATRTAPSVQGLLDAGARLVGKTRTDVFGRTLDGAARVHGTGDAATGAAHAVAEGLADLALCTDVKGSIAASAGSLGLFGLRCSHGRVTLQGCVVPAPSLIAAGLVAREAEPLVRGAGALLGADPAPLPRRPRLLLDVDGFASLALAARERLAPALPRIEAVLGAASLVEAATEGTEALSRALDTLHGHEAWETHGKVIDRLDPALGAWIGGERWSAARALTRAEVAAARRRRTAFTARLTRLVGTDAVLLLPTLPGEPADPAIGDHGTLSLAILSGLPQVSIPVEERGPSLSLIGPPGSDLGLARLAAQLAGELR